MSIKRSQIKNKKPPTKDFLQPQIKDYLSTFFATQTIVIRVYKEDDWLASTSPLQLLLWTLFYAVYCIYCSGCSKFLVQSADITLQTLFTKRMVEIFVAGSVSWGASYTPILLCTPTGRWWNVCTYFDIQTIIKKNWRGNINILFLIFVTWNWGY